jgi:hypothetical protein
MILQNEGFSNIRLELEQATCPLLRPLRSMASSIPTEAARNGAIEDVPVLATQMAPSIVAEWALIPLVCHLTTRHYNFQLAGEAGLT